LARKRHANAALREPQVRWRVGTAEYARWRMPTHRRPTRALGTVLHAQRESADAKDKAAG